MEIKFTFDDQVAGDFERSQRMLAADKLLNILRSLEDDLRRKIKYQDLSEELLKAYQEMRSFLHDQIHEHQLYNLFND